MQKLLAIQESNATNDTNSVDKKAFKVARRAGGQVLKKRKTDDLTVPEVYTFGAVEVRLWWFNKLFSYFDKVIDIGYTWGG